jgi:hypothetical protein
MNMDTLRTQILSHNLGLPLDIIGPCGIIHGLCVRYASEAHMCHKCVR